MNGQQNGNNRLNGYVEVNVRIMQFYEKYPDGSIQTEIVSWQDGVVVMKAYAYRHPLDERPATGHAYEKEGSSQVNRTSALENCETSAVGRALALLGFEIKKSVASKEEVENAIHQQESPQPNVNPLLATPTQRKIIASLYREIVITEEEFKEINKTLEIVSKEKMTKDQAQKLIETLATYPKKEVAANA